MTPNGLLEMLFIRAWMIHEEFRLRDIKENPRWFIFIMAVIPMFVDVIVYDSSVHPETFSPYVQAGMKIAGTTAIVLSRLPIFVTGAFSTLASIAILDFCMGIAITLRYFIFTGLGISLAAYTPDEFRVVPILGLLVTVCFIQVTIIPWLRKYRRAMNYPGPALKTMVFFYWAPSVVMVRPMNAIDFSDSTVIIISCITNLAVICFGWLYLIGRRRRIRMENHYLAMQTELFVEHNQILKEQAEFIKMCRGYLKSLDIGVPQMKFPETSVHRCTGGYSPNELLDTAISDKVEQGRSTGIPVTVEMKGLVLPGGVPEIHFLTIFYNLFDNALEAAGQCETEKQYLKVNAHTDEQGLYLIMENSARPDRPKGKLLTTKADKQNHGQIHIKEEKASFTAEVFLPKK